MNENEFIIEKKKTEQVQNFIEKEILRLDEIIKTCKDNVRSRGAKFNTDNPIGGMYSGMELTNLHYEMEKDIVGAENAKFEIAFLSKLKNNPYFSRVDFKQDNCNFNQEIYIGLRNLQDPETFDILVCDWRAPIASLFYDDFEEKAYYQAPRGKIEGKILLKRQYKFEKGELKYYTDSDLKIDDDILREVLSTASTEHLKVIVNSIQREQNKAIRYSENSNVLIYGPAGSGKTSVGFHRIAYLLYQTNKDLSSTDVVMFSNNDIFSSYVADIIPELGEMPIEYTSFYKIFEKELPKCNVNDYYSLAESIIKNDSKREISASIKSSKEFIEFMEQETAMYQPEFENIELYGKTIVGKDEISAQFLSNINDSMKLRYDRVKEYVNTKIDEFFKNNYDTLFEFIDKNSEIYDDTDSLIRQNRRLLKSSSAKLIEDKIFIDPVILYNKIWEKFISVSKNELLQNVENTKFIQFEDALCILYIKYILGNLEINYDVKHVLIDEAQDLSWLQHKVIISMYPNAKFTILADGNQAIVPSVNIPDMDDLAKLYNAQKLLLNKSYRSTLEINKYALKLLPKECVYDIFERPGDPVKNIKSMEELYEKLNDYLKISHSVALITKTLEDAEILYEKLKSRIENLVLCNNRSAEISDSPVIMPVSLTKGLEFDSVIVFNKDKCFDGEQNLRYKYMAVTRALHRLTIANI